LTPIAATLRRVADELHNAAGRLERVQAAVGGLVSLSAPPTHARDLQEIDRATQEIEGIAAFLEKLAPQVPAEWVADAVKASGTIGLHDLACRLAGREEVQAEAASEAYELFD
jgi:hypothetical protein